LPTALIPGSVSQEQWTAKCFEQDIRDMYTWSWNHSPVIWSRVNWYIDNSVTEVISASILKVVLEDYSYKVGILIITARTSNLALLPIELNSCSSKAVALLTEMSRVLQMWYIATNNVSRLYHHAENHRTLLVYGLV